MAAIALVSVWFRFVIFLKMASLVGRYTYINTELSDKFGHLSVLGINWIRCVSKIQGRTQGCPRGPGPLRA